MLFICISIAIVATSAFLWNKKQNKDLGQIKNIYTSDQSTSPGSGYYNADKELGSLPLQSLVQTANVHYGETPDIKSKIIFLFCPMFFELIGYTSGSLVKYIYIEYFLAKWHQTKTSMM